MKTQSPHTSVLQAEVVEAFKEVDIKNFFDGTLGGGGHACALLEAHPEIQTYLGCDRDPKAHEIAKERLAPWGKKVELIRGSYSDLSRFLQERKIDSIEGFLIDIGVSSMQINSEDRGFSFRFDAPLDMRMDPDSSLTAYDIVNTYPQKELERIFRDYGEEPRARKAAEVIVQSRRKKKINTTFQLSHILEPILRKGKLHHATLVFQALRIAVNDELQELEKGLQEAIAALSIGGRLAIISFHSLEDRIVKQTLRSMKELRVLTKKPIVPELSERMQNRRARSAKLRIAEKIGDIC